MPNRDRRSALRAVSAAIGDAEGKLGALAAVPVDAPEPEPTPEPVTVTLVPEPKPAERRSAPKAKPAPPAPSSEELLPSEWLQRIDDAKQAEAVDVGGERVRRRVEEETVYLAVRVPRSLRDAVRRRADRLDVSIQEFVVHAAQMLLEATARAAIED